MAAGSIKDVIFGTMVRISSTKIDVLTEDLTVSSTLSGYIPVVSKEVEKVCTI